MDRDILQQFYRRYSREIYLYLYSLCKSRETAEDLMQEVFGEKKEKAEKLGVEAYRLSFTTETEKETEKIARAFVEVYLRGQKPDGWMQTEETTKGHFQRGVE